MVITYDSEGTRAPGTWRPDGDGALVVCPACKARTLTVNAEDINGERVELQCKCGLNETATLVAFKVPDPHHIPKIRIKTPEEIEAPDIGEPRTGGEIADDLDPDRVRSGDKLLDSDKGHTHI